MSTDSYIKYHEIASGWIADYADDLEKQFGADTFRRRIYPWMVGYIVAEFMAGNGKPAYFRGLPGLPFFDWCA